MSLLFTPFTIRNVELKNRIMMSPMGTLAAGEDGKVTEWHKLHYGARALGQVALIMLEVSAVMEQGRDSGSLGIWSDDHIPKLKELTELLHAQGSKAGIQLWLAGRKTNRQGMAVSASEIADRERVARVLTLEEIQDVIYAFKAAAIRAAAAGFDVIELHAAHGYLLNDFLSPYTNKREDQYGGTREKRFRLLQEVITEIRGVWNGPLFVRVSAEEYGPEGNRVEDYVYYASRMKELGVDLIDVSSGGVYPDKPKVYPGYQVPYSEQIRRGSGLPTAAVGLITSGLQAEEILQNGRADLIAVGRELLRNPFWPRVAAEQLGINIDEPAPYRGHWFDYRHAVSE
ncbi:NADPH dehydrogenase NamA [Paenibacillus sp. PL91]|uniref:NADPH dehydrogenase NamA n=1 Tax=Paenibacillus sp. PL91 TaxID=2729538 RepID=UPI00145F9DA2|nr:NADPH dehydrogenase NamA [Paenibacillus sp. PL91]MBC9204905.1 NADPH dehydrogenase NamA [Paenibacillus sp. PL91]